MTRFTVMVPEWFADADAGSYSTMDDAVFEAEALAIRGNNAKGEAQPNRRVLVVKEVSYLLPLGWKLERNLTVWESVR